MTDGPTELTVQLQADPDVDENELADLAETLRDELSELDVERVVPAAGGEAPADAKGVELLAIGALFVQFVLSPEVLKSILDGVRSWLGRQRVHTSVKLTLDGDTWEETGLSSAELDRLRDLWIARHVSA